MEDWTLDSLREAIDSGEVEQLAQLIERYWGQLIRADDSLLYKAIDIIPAGMRQRYPAVVLAAEVYYPLNPSVRRDGDAQINHILESFDTDGDNQLRVSRGIAALVGMKRRGDYRTAADFGSRVTVAAERALAPIGPDRVRPETAAAAFLHAGIVDLLSGRFEAAERHFKAAIRKPSSILAQAFDAAGKLALSYVLQGESHLAQIWLARADEESTSTDPRWRFAPTERLAVDAARMLMAVDAMDWAEFHRHSRAADTHHSSEMWPLVLYARARAALVLGSQRDAIYHLQQLRHNHPELFTPAGLPQLLFDTAEAELWMSVGQYEEAQRVIAGFGDHPLEDIAAARYYLLTGKPDLAQARTDPSRWPVPLSRRNRLDLTLLAVAAHLRLHLHDAQRVELLRQAATAVATEVKPWLFSFTLADSDVLRLLAQHFPEVEPILAAVADQDTTNPFGSSHKTVRLTRRERLLLQYLAMDLPMGDIANQLGISSATIFNHRKNLYRKLGATSRAHAVEIGRRAGLIDITGPGSAPPS